MAAARIPGNLVEHDPGKQPEGRGAGPPGPASTGSAGWGAGRVSWHADNLRRWHSWLVHLLPAERSGQRVIDGERVCQAIAALGPETDVQARAKTFAILGDPTRLTLLTCIRAAGPISVSDLAAATGFHDTTVSQTLRYLRAAEVVTAERDGRVIRYQLTDGPVAALLAR
jgi:ArsR family transcriptional regulator, lead/cadmium/zinc/bismuth-responsive transcriptional repressor